MRILGITGEGDSGASVVEDGRLLAAVNEERLTRMKMVIGFPRNAIRCVLEMTDTDVADLDAVVIASHYTLLADQLEPFDGWFQHKPGGLAGLLKTQGASLFSRFHRWLPGLESIYYAVLGPSFAKRRRALRRILREEFQVRCPIEFVDHHFAHITSAYFTSGFRDSLVLSVDGGGDKKSALVYAVRDGNFERLGEVSAFNSLGNYYAYVTHLCGFKAMKHEGKITGLAAHGEPKYIELLRQFIDEEHGSFVNKGGAVNLAAVRKLGHALPKDWKREDLAASIQKHFEELVGRFVAHWVGQTGLTDLALAGGVFANVRVNQVVFETPGVERVFIHPHMGDGGLHAGAALAGCVRGVLEVTCPSPGDPLESVYLGPSLNEDEIQNALAKFELSSLKLTAPLEDTIAGLLADGYVVARANGAMEYGPRALGNRSILYQPTDPSVNDWLNQNLQRTEFMPFAPAVLYEQREKCFGPMGGAEYASEFMTVTFDCTDWMREHMPGVVHIDNTARPQLVRRDKNPSFYRVIEAFYQRTGLPGIINTSFNMHEEPIVCSADDCLRAFLDGNLDYLAIGAHLVRHPRGASHALTPVHAAEPRSV